MWADLLYMLTFMVVCVSVIPLGIGAFAVSAWIARRLRD